MTTKESVTTYTDAFSQLADGLVSGGNTRFTGSFWEFLRDIWKSQSRRVAAFGDPPRSPKAPTLQ